MWQYLCVQSMPTCNTKTRCIMTGETSGVQFGMDMQQQPLAALNLFSMRHMPRDQRLQLGSACVINMTYLTL
jgi:hypothetical protein